MMKHFTLFLTFTLLTLTVSVNATNLLSDQSIAITKVDDKAKKKAQKERAKAKKEQAKEKEKLKKAKAKEKARAQKVRMRDKEQARKQKEIDQKRKK